MKGKTNTAKQPVKQITDKVKPSELEYPLYPVNEDIYNQLLREELVDPEYFAADKTNNPALKNGDVSQTDFINAISGKDLDIPGSELDDEQEKIGSEDEENNYYSVGGDNHDNLEEDKGE
ncbi:MAG: hypothetical protein ABL872_19330 [Lacibacter sp.]